MNNPQSQPDALAAGQSVEVAQQLATAVDAGLPLSPALRALADDLPDQQVGAALARLADALDRGEPLEAAVGQVGLAAHLQGIVLAGSRSGSLAAALMQYSEHRRALAAMRQQVVLSAVYPAFVFFGLLAVLWGAAQIASSGAKDMLEDFGVEIPYTTRMLAGLTGLTSSFVLGVAAVMLTVLIMRPARWRGGWKRIPLLGPAWRWMGQAEFCQLLALLIDRQVALPAALRLTADGLADNDLAAASRRLAVSVEQGVPLGEAIAYEREFARTLSPWIAWAQQANVLGDGLATAAEMFRARVRSQIGLLRTVLPPIMLIVVSWGISFIAMALILPMVRLIGALS